jgi:hypothetical protein
MLKYMLLKLYSTNQVKFTHKPPKKNRLFGDSLVDLGLREKVDQIALKRKSV